MIRSILFVASLVFLGGHQNALAADGKALYQTSCVACHGAKAEGSIPGVPNLKTSGRLSQTDAVLVNRILNGFQTKGSPMAMPAKGGNPTLTAADAQALVIYMRSISGTSVLPTRSKSATAKDSPAVVPVAKSTAPARTVSVSSKRSAVPVNTIASTPAASIYTTADPVPFAEAVQYLPTAASPSPEAIPVLGVQSDMTAFTNGAKAWANNCARCHTMRDPKDLSDRHWKIVMTHMRLRASLDGKQVRDITAFLQRSN